MAIISKLDAAVHQHNLAIGLFLEGDYLASLTLAGAAEGILASLCKVANKPVAADFIASYHEKDVDTSVPAGKRRDVVLKVLNRARNAAKHADKAEELTVEVEQIHPLPMCASLGIKPSTEMEAMTRWVDGHPEAQQ